MSQWFLGMDGGQSSTTAVIGDASGRVAGVGRGGPVEHVGAQGGREALARAMRECVTAAGAAAKLDVGALRFQAACLGFSGGPEDKEALLREILAVDRVVAATDAHVALAGATGGAPGIVVIAGTGSIALGRNAAGQTARAGGWGYIFGDQGGGFDIVREALRAALRQEEGWGPATTLHGALLQATGSTSANQLLHRFYSTEFPRARVAALAPLVDQAAREGDKVAHDILDQAARELAGLASTVRAQLFTHGEPVRVSHAGGVFRCAALRERYAELVETTENSHYHPPLYGPAVGALLEAYRAVDLTPHLSNLPKVEK